MQVTSTIKTSAQNLKINKMELTALGMKVMTNSQLILNIAYTKRIYIQSTNPYVSNHQLFY